VFFFPAKGGGGIYTIDLRPFWTTRHFSVTDYTDQQLSTTLLLIISTALCTSGRSQQPYVHGRSAQRTQ